MYSGKRKEGREGEELPSLQGEREEGRKEENTVPEKARPLTHGRAGYKKVRGQIRQIFLFSKPRARLEFPTRRGKSIIFPPISLKEKKISGEFFTWEEGSRLRSAGCAREKIAPENSKNCLIAIFLPSSSSFFSRDPQIFPAPSFSPILRANKRRRDYCRPTSSFAH